MSKITLPDCLRPLVEFLESLEARASQEKLGRLLAELTIDAEDLEPFVEFGCDTYRRNLICENQWYELLCICWKSGQRSPIHNHARSTCGLRIIEGVATETLFAMTDCGQIKAVESVDYPVGHHCTTEDADIHQVSNLQGKDRNLITLHIYSPPLRTMDTYSLMNSDVEEYSPNNKAYCHIGDCI